MKNLLLNLKAEQTGSYKVEVGARTFCKSEPEPKQIVLAPQHCWVILDLFPPVHFVPAAVSPDRPPDLASDTTFGTFIVSSRKCLTVLPGL